MRIALVVGLALAAACARVERRPDAGLAASHWQGYVLRDGLRSSVVVDLSGSDQGWGTRLSAGYNSVPLQQVRISATQAHFELPGEGVFDGSIAEDEMAGAVTGDADGAFRLVRSEGDFSPYPFGP
jgi:hypothetical protein